jgi:hypothetical protein
MSRRKTTREYCVGINAWSLNVIWVEADSAEHAHTLAQDLWSQDESAFSYKDGGIDGVFVLSSREVPS